MKAKFAHAELEKLVKDLEKDLEITYLLGKQDGERTEPIAEAYWRGRVFNSVEVKTQNVINQVRNTLQPLSGITVQRNFWQTSHERVNFLNTERNHIDIQVYNLKKKIEELELDEENKFKFYLVYGFVVSISIGDAYFIMDASLGGGLPFIPSIILGVCGGLAMGLGTHYLTEYAMKATSKLARRFRFLAGSVAATTFFTIVGYFRAYLYNSIIDLNTDPSASTITSQSTPGWLIGLISTFLFVFALFFSRMIHRSEERKRLSKELNNLKLKLRRLTLENDLNKSTSENLKAAASENSDYAVQVVEYALSIRDRITNIAYNALANYSQAYLISRPVSDCPKFLSNFPPFNF